MNRNKMAEIVGKIAKKYKVTIGEIYGRGRTKTVVLARQSVYKKMRDMGMSYPEIGKAVNRVHTTILIALKSHTKDK